MSRLPRLVAALVAGATALSFTACKTIYSDTYSWRRNYYKPPQEAPTTPAADLLLPASTTPTMPPPSLPTFDAPPPAMEPIPGLDPAPLPEMEGAAPDAVEMTIPGL